MPLKEQDDFFDLILAQHTLLARSGTADPIAAAFSWAQSLLDAHVAATLAGAPSSSELSALVPSMGKAWLALDLGLALATVDARARLRARRLVPPSFAEVRRVVNEATVVASARGLALLTLDADNTIYSDGGTLTFDAPIVPLLVRVLRAGVKVAIVTAASYPGEPARFEARLEGLLSAASFAIEAGAPATLLDNFYVMGGQCSYLLRARVEAPSARVYLEEVPGEEWKRFRGVRWDHDAVVATLDVAEASLRESIAALDLDVLLVRKERAVGILPRTATGGRVLSYEVLEELTLAAQEALATRGPRSVPTCAFNGGRDVFVDIGSKALGILALQGLLSASPTTTVHIGDRFTRSGNDFRARDCSSCLWVANPRETCELLNSLIPLLASRAQPATPQNAQLAPLSIASPRVVVSAPDSSLLNSLTPREAANKPLLFLPAASAPSGAPTLPSSGANAASQKPLAPAPALPSTFRRTLEQRLANEGEQRTGWGVGVPVGVRSAAVVDDSVHASGGDGSLSPRFFSRGPGVSGRDRFTGIDRGDAESDAALLNDVSRSQWLATGATVLLDRAASGLERAVSGSSSS
jgi:IMP and pyridine-specific 5'-nucleotidase